MSQSNAPNGDLLNGHSTKHKSASDSLAAKLNSFNLGSAKSSADALLQSLLSNNMAIQRKLNKGQIDPSKEYRFWSTQPVPQLSSINSNNSLPTHGPIETKSIDQVSKDPYPLPQGFKWCSLSMEEEKQAEEVYKLLNENYVEDDDNMFRFDYSKRFLQWALRPPGYDKEWHIGVRAAKNGKLVAFISGVPADIRVYDKKMRMVEINFLCVHKKLRSKRLAPVLIKEVTRRVNLRNIWQAAYTAGVVLPKPVAQNRYWHRSLNPKKLIEIGFSRLQPKMTMARTIKLYKMNQLSTAGFRKMEITDIEKVCDLLNTFLSKFQLAPVFTNEDVQHWLLPRDGVISSFVVQNAKHDITDFCSYYSLPSTIIGNDKYSTLKAAYSYYNVSTVTPWVQLMNDALYMAAQEGFDVFNALNVMENDQFLQKCKFGIGDGHLQYYLYNWNCPEMKPNQVGLVLL